MQAFRKRNLFFFIHGAQTLSTYYILLLFDHILCNWFGNLDPVLVRRIHFRLSCGSARLCALLSLLSCKGLELLQIFATHPISVRTVLIPSSSMHTLLSNSLNMKCPSACRSARNLTVTWATCPISTRFALISLRVTVLQVVLSRHVAQPLNCLTHRIRLRPQNTALHCLR